MIQKYYIAACFNPLDTRVPTLLVDADDEHGTYYRCRDIDPELARLRERVGELERTLAVVRQNNQLNQEEHAEREQLLLEAVRWCMCYRSRMQGINPPAHLAPLIAEAAEKKP